MVELTLEEEIYVFENRIKLLHELFKRCQIDQNIGFFFWEEKLPFNPENINNRLEYGVQDIRPVKDIILEADDLWEGIKKQFVKGIIALNGEDRANY